MVGDKEILAQRPTPAFAVVIKFVMHAREIIYLKGELLNARPALQENIIMKQVKPLANLVKEVIFVPGILIYQFIGSK